MEKVASIMTPGFTDRQSATNSTGASGGSSFGELKPFTSSRDTRSRSPQFTNDSSSGGRSVSTETRTITEGSGANKVTKTIVTETVTEADGRKQTTTKETVTSGDGGSGGTDPFDGRFKSMGIDREPKASGGSSFAPSRSDKEKKPQKNKNFIDDVVKSHNKYRKQHGNVGDLKHNKEMDVLAQRWADHLASTTVLAHSNHTYQGKGLGENVASKYSSAGADYTGQDAVDQWYSEVSKYDYRGDFLPGTGHFSQIVWKGSKEVGVGKAYSADGNRVFVVCNYHPAGNVMGQFQGNVFKK